MVMLPTARAAFKEGAFDFVEKPLDLAVFREVVNRAPKPVLVRAESGELGGLTSGGRLRGHRRRQRRRCGRSCAR
jgi:DNA-binding NtrC family response regulator